MKKRLLGILLTLVLLANPAGAVAEPGGAVPDGSEVMNVIIPISPGGPSEEPSGETPPGAESSGAESSGGEPAVRELSGGEPAGELEPGGSESDASDGAGGSDGSEVLNIIIPTSPGQPAAEEPGEEIPAEPEGDIPGGSQPEDYGILNVIVPSTVQLTINPLELNGRGQIYSDDYRIENRGDTDVLLTFTDIEVIFANDTEFEPLAEPFEENGSKRKSIYLLMDFGRSDFPPVVLTDFSREAGEPIPLYAAQSGPTEKSSVSLRFSGSVNHAPAVDWQDGDVKINLTYRLEAVPPPDEENQPADEENQPADEEEPLEAAGDKEKTPDNAAAEPDNIKAEEAMPGGSLPETPPAEPATPGIGTPVENPVSEELPDGIPVPETDNTPGAVPDGTG